MEIKIKWIKRKQMTHENTYRDDKKNTKRGRVIASSAYEFIIIYEEQRKERKY